MHYVIMLRAPPPLLTFTLNSQLSTMHLFRHIFDVSLVSFIATYKEEHPCLNIIVYLKSRLVMTKFTQHIYSVSKDLVNQHQNTVIMALIFCLCNMQLKDRI